MSGPAYRFERQSQLQTCLEMALPHVLTLDPSNAVPVQDLPSTTRCFAVSPSGELAWLDRAGVLRRDLSCAGPILPEARRIVFGTRSIWVLDEDTLTLVDGETLQLLDTFALGSHCDIATDGGNGLWILSGGEALHWDGQGREVGREPLKGPVDSIARVGSALAILSRKGNRLLIKESSHPLDLPLELILGEGNPSFTAKRIIGASSLLLLEGNFEKTEGELGTEKQQGILLLDAGGNPAGYGVWKEGQLPLALALAGEDLIALFDLRGKVEAVRFTAIGSIGAKRLITPALDSDTLAGDWLRSEVTALVGDGATVSLRFASTKDERLREAAQEIFTDEARTVSSRAAELHQLLPWSDKVRTYVASVAGPKPEEQDFAFPLFEAEGNILWVEVTLEANGSAAPKIRSLVVRHDCPTLMDHLPAVFKSPEGDLGNVLRSLVSVVETTAQELDQSIAKLGERLDPRRTNAQWLPDLAGLLGLPFDEALQSGQQRRLVGRAVDILTGRGTLRGIAALLEALFGEHSYRVTDRSAQVAPIMLGGGGVSGSSLPAFIAGASSNIPKLNARLILGKTALCKADACDEARVGRAPELLVEIAASASEATRLAAPVRQMIESLLPAGIGLRLRWRGSAFAHDDVISILSEPKVVVIGDGPVVGGGRLGGHRPARLGNGIPIEHRLQ